jgi:hypothetical protein
LNCTEEELAVFRNWLSTIQLLMVDGCRWIVAAYGSLGRQQAESIFVLRCILAARKLTETEITFCLVIQNDGYWVLDLGLFAGP